MNEIACIINITSGVIRAGFLYYATCYISDAYKQKSFKQMIEYYPFLVEAAIQFKRFSRKFLAKYKSK